MVRHPPLFAAFLFLLPFCMSEMTHVQRSSSSSSESVSTTRNWGLLANVSRKFLGKGGEGRVATHAKKKVLIESERL